MNHIHETAYVGPDVILGDNNYIGPYCYITGHTTIGSDNHFEAFCSIGSPAEHRDYFKDNTGLTSIGSGNVFREYVTVNAGTIETTAMGNDNIMLRGSHVGHDSIIYNRVNLSCNVLIGGHSVVMDGVNFGLGSVCHQFSVIGAYSMIGMNSTVTKSSRIEPGNVYVGSPVKCLRKNEVGLDRNDINPLKLREFQKLYETLVNEK